MTPTKIVKIDGSEDHITNEQIIRTVNTQTSITDEEVEDILSELQTRFGNYFVGEEPKIPESQVCEIVNAYVKRLQKAFDAYRSCLHIMHLNELQAVKNDTKRKFLLEQAQQLKRNKDKFDNWEDSYATWQTEVGNVHPDAIAATTAGKVMKMIWMFAKWMYSELS